MNFLRNTKTTKGLFIIILLIAFIVRVYKIEEKPFNFDELSSIGCAIGIPYAGINQVHSSTWGKIEINSKKFTPKSFFKYNNLQHVYLSTLEDNGSILYFIILHFWFKIFGISTFTLKILGVICTLITIIFSFLIIKKLTKNTSISLLGIFIYALLPLSILASNYGRSHSIAGMFATISTYLFFGIILDNEIEKKNYRIIFYGLFSGCAMLCHYFTLYVFVGHILIMLFFIQNITIWKKIVIGGFITIIIFGTWLFLGGFKGMEIVNNVHLQFLAQALKWKPGDNPYYIPSTFSHLIGGTTQVLLPVFGNSFQDFGYSLSKLIFLLFIPFSIIFYAFIKVNRADKRIILILGIMIFAQLFWSIIVSLKMGYMIFLQPLYAQYILPYCVGIISFSIYKIYINKNYNFLTNFMSITFFIILLISIKTCYIKASPSPKKSFDLVNEINTFYENGDTILYNNFNTAFYTNILMKNKKYNQKIDSTIKFISIKNKENKIIKNITQF